MKRELALCMALLSGISLFGCGKENKTDKNDALETTATVAVNAEVEEDTQAETDKAKENNEEKNEEAKEAEQEIKENEKKDNPDEYSEEISREQSEQFRNELAIVGDSIAYGYAAYEKMPMNHVFAQQGVDLTKVRDTVFSSDYGDSYALDIISALHPKYLMLSMGMNEIGNRKYEAFAEKYKELAEDFHEASPNTIIYVAALTPVCDDAETDLINNENISEHNKVLENTFKGENNIFYVNIGKILTNSNGKLDSKYSGGDGIHLSSDAYDMLLDELARYAE